VECRSPVDKTGTERKSLVPKSHRTDRGFGNRLVDSLLVRRILHDCERRYLAPETQGRIYRYIATEEVPLEITERAIQEAVSLGALKNSAVEAPLFDAIVDALLDDRSFEIPGSPSEKVYPSSCWIC